MVPLYDDPGIGRLLIQSLLNAFDLSLRIYGVLLYTDIGEIFHLWNTGNMSHLSHEGYFLDVLFFFSSSVLSGISST